MGSRRNSLSFRPLMTDVIDAISIREKRSSAHQPGAAQECGTRPIRWQDHESRDDNTGIQDTTSAGLVCLMPPPWALAFQLPAVLSPITDHRPPRVVSLGHRTRAIDSSHERARSTNRYHRTSCIEAYKASAHSNSHESPDSACGLRRRPHHHTWTKDGHTGRIGGQT